MIAEPGISAAAVLVAVAAGALLFMPRVIHAERWRATVTPLASIIGSGFLILGPILIRTFGQWAPLTMLGLCGVAFAFGTSIRSNILHLEPLQARGELPSVTKWLERASSWALAAAYVVSVTYYLNLLGSFSVSLTPFDGALAARVVTTVVLGFIGLYGLRRGLASLETVEIGAVSVKLAIIAGLLVALGWFSLRRLANGALIENPAPGGGVDSILVAFGLVITIQGFETSRYLGEEHDAATRVSTMRQAQWISTAIYVTYVVAMTWSFHADQIDKDETAIIGLTGTVAPVLPAMLVIAALTAQFSAAVADTAGCGGLVHELSRGKIKAHAGYLGVTIMGLALTWTSDVFEIIAFASRAFAVYYALQCFVATTLAHARGARVATVGHAAMGLLGFLIAIFGTTVE